MTVTKLNWLYCSPIKVKSLFRCATSWMNWPRNIHINLNCGILLIKPVKVGPTVLLLLTTMMIKVHLFPDDGSTITLMCGTPPMINFARNPALDKLGYYHPDNRFAY